MGEEMLQPNITVSSRATFAKLLACVPIGAGAAVPAGASVAAGACVAAGVPQAVTTIATSISMLNNLNFFIFFILLFLISHIVFQITARDMMSYCAPATSFTP
jgi:hypothetical protein